MSSEGTNRNLLCVVQIECFLTLYGCIREQEYWKKRPKSSGWKKSQRDINNAQDGWNTVSHADSISPPSVQNEKVCPTEYALLIVCRSYSLIDIWVLVMIF